MYLWDGHGLVVEGDEATHPDNAAAVGGAGGRPASSGGPVSAGSGGRLPRDDAAAKKHRHVALVIEWGMSVGHKQRLSRSTVQGFTSGTGSVTTASQTYKLRVGSSNL
eukprot:scaffold116009_cov42-Prasinocladus_malaysianus.AAC.1